MTTPRDASFISCVKTMRASGDKIIAVAKHDPATGEHWFAFPTVPASREGTMFLAIFREGGTDGRLVMCPGGDYLLRGDDAVDIGGEVLPAFKEAAEALIGSFELVARLTPGYKTERTIIAKDFYTLEREAAAHPRAERRLETTPVRKPAAAPKAKAPANPDEVARTTSLNELTDF